MTLRRDFLRHFRGAQTREPGISRHNFEIPGPMPSLSSGRASRGPVGIAPE
jgi:hypothetical protein